MTRPERHTVRAVPHGGAYTEWTASDAAAARRIADEAHRTGWYVEVSIYRGRKLIETERAS